MAFYGRLSSAAAEAKAEAKQISPTTRSRGNGRAGTSAPSVADARSLSSRSSATPSLSSLPESLSPSPSSYVRSIDEIDEHKDASATVVERGSADVHVVGAGVGERHDMRGPMVGPMVGLSKGVRSIEIGAKASESDDESEEDEHILHKVSEYLFDLYDANMLEDFKVMEKFERAVVDKFDPDGEEFSFEHQDLHKQYCELFESLVSKFIEGEGYTMEEFYEVVRAHVQSGGTEAEEKEHSQDASEVMSVVYSCSDFKTWADDMREQARQSARYTANKLKEHSRSLSPTTTMSKKASAAETFRF